MPLEPAAALGAVALLLSLTAVVLATIANRRWVRRSRAAASEAEVAALTADVASLRAALDAVHAGVLAAASSGATSLRHVAVTRYDAFAEVGGRLSYSVALLDDTGSGIVLTTLAGKSDVRTYVRAICEGSGDGTLTAEEQQAIEAAVGSRQ
ncbi:MAG: DUF4446 family protein [Candidatus Nanopelagicales bacterium]